MNRELTDKILSVKNLINEQKVTIKELREEVNRHRKLTKTSNSLAAITSIILLANIILLLTN